MKTINLLAKIKKILKISFFIYVVFIIAVNGFFYLSVGFGMSKTLYNDGLIILGPGDHAYLFVHGVQGMIPPEDKTPCLTNASFVGNIINHAEFNNLTDEYIFENLTWRNILGDGHSMILNHSQVYNRSCLKKQYTLAHFTYYSNKSVPTLSLIQSLHNQGYKQIWGTWCQSGNTKYIMKYPNGTEIPWPDNVTRKTKPGITIPIFIGYKFILI